MTNKDYIYLDSAATTQPHPIALDALLQAVNIYGNPSSMHHLGIEAEKMLNDARQTISNILCAKPREIIFTAGATEANNMALFSSAKKHKGMRIITTLAEHSSILKALSHLTHLGFEIYYTKLDSQGKVDIAELSQALKTPTCLVCFHHINNHTGIIQDITKLGSLIKSQSPDTLFLVDAAQSFCKTAIDVNANNIDFLSLSGHKIGCIKGVGALYVKNGILSPRLFGGGQEFGLRSGTENTPAIACLAAIAKYRQANIDNAWHHTLNLKKTFLTLIKHNTGVVENINQDIENISPYILSISLEDIRSEVMLNSLSAKGLYISAGSACSSKNKAKSVQYALLGSSIEAYRTDSSLRISFSAENTISEIEQAANIFNNELIILKGHKRYRQR